MSASRDIPVAVAAPAPDRTLSGNADALLHEIATLLAGLVAEGRRGAIDLQSVPLTTGDRAWLRECLGEGEIRAEVNVLGLSEARETAFRGVWWVTHRNAAGATGAELIEVTPLPAILESDADEMAEASQRLRAALDARAGKNEAAGGRL